MKDVLRFAAIIVLAGCSTARGPAPEPREVSPATAAPTPLPAQLEPQPEIDYGALTGRRVCIDPGHGGQWPGAVARSNGLRESDVNLAVATRLAAVLANHGAEIRLTRTADVALDATALTRDLAARPALAGAFDADVFISIHHNADIVRGSRRNDLEVYYKLGDDAASLELAQQLTSALALGLRNDASPKRLLPGNYKVLRLASMPAVLIESAYLTNPDGADYFASPSAIEKEASAIAEGLARYFMMDPPEVRLTAATSSAVNGALELRASIARGLPIDQDSIEVRVDGERVEGVGSLDGGQLTWTGLAPVENRRHTVELRMRNERGASGVVKQDLEVDRPPAHIWVRQQPAPAPESYPVRTLFEVFVVDAFGLPVADGRAVNVDRHIGATTRDGIARLYLDTQPARVAVGISADGIFESAPLRRGNSTAQTATVVDATSNSPLPGAVAVLPGGTTVPVTPEGWFSIASRGEATVKAAGYETQRIALENGHTVVAMHSVVAQTLIGKHVVLDAANGGRDPGTAGPSGVRGSDLTLDLVRRTAVSLRQRGARVTLIREDDSELTDLERVARAEQANGDIVVSVAFGLASDDARLVDSEGFQRTDLSAYVGYYPNSANGLRLATAISKEWGGIPVTECVAYLLQQAAAPAVLVQPATLDSREAELRYAAQETRRGLADRLVTAIEVYFTQPGPIGASSP